MQAEHIRNLRRILVGIIALVILAVLFNYLQTWRRRARIVRQATQLLSTETLRAADRIEYSEHENGRVRFRVRAKRLLETRKGINHLEDVEAFDFHPDGTVRNQIRSLRAEYDADRKVAVFSGNVRIAVGKGIELETDSLQYDMLSSIGETEGLLRLRSEQASGTAQGIRYDHAAKILEMKSSLDFVLSRSIRNRDGSRETERARASSQRGYYSHRDRILRFEGNAKIESAEDSLSGNSIVARLAEDGKKVSSLLAVGDTHYQSRANDLVRSLAGDRIRFDIDTRNDTLDSIYVEGRGSFRNATSAGSEEFRASTIRVKFDPALETPRELEGSTGVQLRMTRGTRTTSASGENLQAAFSAGTNQLESLYLSGGATLHGQGEDSTVSDELSAEEIRLAFRIIQGRNNLKDLRADRQVRWKTESVSRAQPGAKPSIRTLRSHTLSLHYSDAEDHAERGSASGDVVLESSPRSTSKGSEIRRLDADRVEFHFFEKGNRIRTFDAEGHVRVAYDQPEAQSFQDGGHSFSTESTNLSARLKAEDGTVESISQWGDFRYEDGTKTASSERADYLADDETLVLKESPRIADAGTATTGEWMEFDRKNKILTVHRRVHSTLLPVKDRPASSPFSSSDKSSPAIITADLMRYWTEERRAEYSGPVSLLSDSSHLQCRKLEVYDQGERVVAQEKIRHIILRAAEEVGQGISSPPSRRDSKASRSRVTISGERMRYLRESNSIQYSGGVTLDTSDVHLESQSLDAVLNSEGKHLTQAAARGNVLIRQGPREARGSMADYFFQPEKFVVVGSPAEIKDPNRGTSRARRLTFFPADDRILLENR